MQNNKQILAPQVKLTSGSCPYFYNMYRCCCETSLKLVYMCQFCTRFTGTGIVFTAGFRTCFNPTPNINLTYGYMFVLNWMYSAQSFPIETASTHTNTHTHTHEARANQISMKPKRPFQGLCFFNPSGK